jgi:hypothetical protein
LLEHEKERLPASWQREIAAKCWLKSSQNVSWLLQHRQPTKLVMFGKVNPQNSQTNSFGNLS